MSQDRAGRRSLAVGGVAAVLASSCCLGPLVLISLGVGGAWAAKLAALEPWRPWFLGVAVAALLAAGWRLYRPRAVCAPTSTCASPATRRIYRVVFWLVAALIALGLVLPYVAHFFY